MDKTGKHFYTNHLANENSPYLLQHAHNPIDWYPWGREAFDLAKKSDLPIFISIGYATCHWCHLMERESFESKKIARLLNENFINIKVDREERPDVDKIYMDALVSLQQPGGWPLNMFLTPHGKPFSGGTYFPPQNRYGRVSFSDVLISIVKFWKNQKNEIYLTANKITDQMIKKSAYDTKPDTKIDQECEKTAYQNLINFYDEEHGGFLHLPKTKFPPNLYLQFLLRYYHSSGELKALSMVKKTLRSMLAGGIYDHIGGGICHSSRDLQWQIPHFEKMLYDNALLAWNLAETFQVTGDDFYRHATTDILSYLERDLRSPEGGFFTAEDSGIDGIEGKYYLWSRAQIFKHLGEDMGELACSFWGIGARGNFEERFSVLHQSTSLEELAITENCSIEEIRERLKTCRQGLWQTRQQRGKLLCDDKILTSWNAITISAFAKAARIFNLPEYRIIAEQAACFIFEKMVNSRGRLLRQYRNGQASIPAFLNDYAQLAIACLDLYECCYKFEWFEKARDLMRDVNQFFFKKSAPYYDNGRDTDPLFVEHVTGHDVVLPSGNSMAAIAFLRLASYDQDHTHRQNARRIITSFEKEINNLGSNFSSLLCAHQLLTSPKIQVIIKGTRGEKITERLLSLVRTQFIPHLATVFVVIGKDREIPPGFNCHLTAETPTAFVSIENGRFIQCHSVRELKHLLIDTKYQGM